MLACSAVAVLGACGEKDEPDPGAAPSVEAGGATAGDQQAGAGGGADREPEPTEGRPVTTPEGAVRRAVAGALGGDPTDACERYVTPRFVREAYGGPGGCRGAQAAGARFEVAVDAVEIRGGRATATARASEGPYAGERLQVTLVGEAMRWRVDALDANVRPGP
ncbi:MAG: hypothetical protein ACRDK9_02225 [Solirubrobacterales bacterium]